MQEFMYKKKQKYLGAAYIFASFTFAAHSAFSAPSHIHKIYFRSYEEPFLSVDHVDAN